jgi:hypothetical protein
MCAHADEGIYIHAVLKVIEAPPVLWSRHSGGVVLGGCAERELIPIEDLGCGAEMLTADEGYESSSSTG